MKLNKPDLILEEGDIICSKCKGVGILKNTICGKCRGSGKLDWIENLTEKKKHILIDLSRPMKFQ